MKFKKVRCKSGVMGEQFKLRDAYRNFEDYEQQCDLWNIHKRLGYKSPKTAWRYNPTVQCSTMASDYRKIIVK